MPAKGTVGLCSRRTSLASVVRGHLGRGILVGDKVSRTRRLCHLKYRQAENEYCRLSRNDAT